MRWILRSLCVAAAMWFLAAGAMLYLMHQPPVEFAGAYAQFPRPMAMAIPFEPLWNIARAGKLSIGDPAPDFDLPSIDKKTRVKLSAYRGQRPVVLVFGSYT